MTKKIEGRDLGRSPLHMIHRASQGADDLLQEIGEIPELTPRQYAVLEVLSRNDGVSQRVLVDETGIDRSTMADIIQRMLAKSYVKRRRSAEDARAYNVRLTDSGLAALKAARPVMRQIDERLLGGLSPKRAEEFIDNLLKIIRSLSADNSEEIAPIRTSKKC